MIHADSQRSALAATMVTFDRALDWNAGMGKADVFHAGQVNADGWMLAQNWILQSTMSPSMFHRHSYNAGVDR